jgi:hypothetical protein
MTHDLSAVRALKRSGERLAPQILRVFDLYTFSYQCGDLSARDCDGARQILNNCSEWIPDAFRHRNFEDGLAGFYPRLQDRNLGPIGSIVPVEIFDVRLLLSERV